MTSRVFAIASAARATSGVCASSAWVAVRRSSLTSVRSLVPVSTLPRFWRESSTSARRCVLRRLPEREEQRRGRDEQRAGEHDPLAPSAGRAGTSTATSIRAWSRAPRFFTLFHYRRLAAGHRRRDGGDRASGPVVRSNLAMPRRSHNTRRGYLDWGDLQRVLGCKVTGFSLSPGFNLRTLAARSLLTRVGAGARVGRAPVE